jgi:hypothetical protein
MKKCAIIAGLGLAGLMGVGWLSYAPALLGYWAGIYPLGVFYSRLLSWPAAVILLIVFHLWFWLAIAAALCCFCLVFTRQRRFRRALIGVLFLPLITLVLLPAAFMTCVPGASVNVEPWGQTYRTAYSAFPSDDTYGNGLVFQCDRSGILCRKVHQFSTSVGTIDHIVLTYKPELDHLIVTDAANVLMYRRSRQTVLCAKIKHFLSTTASPLCDQSP